MNRRISTFGLQTRSIILFAAALMMCHAPARATTTPVTVGGPFALVAPDGATVTDQTYRGKWLLESWFGLFEQFWAAAKWISALVMPRPGLAAAR
jgi:hypothetical protein